MSNEESPAPPPVQKKGRGCFFWGCLTSVILLVVFAIGIVIVAKLFINGANKFITQYADTKAESLPVVDLPAAEMKSVLEHLTNFSTALDNHSNTPPLILTGPQVNALLESRPELSNLKGKFYVSFVDDQAKAQISIPLESVPLINRLDSSKGHYLNGTGTFNIGLSNGFLIVHLTALEVKDKPISAQYLANMRRQNWADKANQGSDTNTFEQLESIVVTNGTLVIQAKTN